MPCCQQRLVALTLLLGVFASGSCGAQQRVASPAPSSNSSPVVSASPPLSLDAPLVEEPAPPTEALSNASRTNTDDSDGPLDGPPRSLADCEARLAAEGVVWRKANLPLITTQGGKAKCGCAQAVVYERGPTGITWGSPVVSCGMAIAFAKMERILQEEAAKHLKQSIRGVLHGTPYQCRSITNVSFSSEHSYANALDIFGFALNGQQRISVLLQFGPTSSEPTTAEGRFLRSLARRLFDERVFSNVLTPFFNAAHRDHIHVDLARYRFDGTR